MLKVLLGRVSITAAGKQRAVSVKRRGKDVADVVILLIIKSFSHLTRLREYIELGYYWMLR